MLPPALGGLRFRVPPVPDHYASGIMSKINPSKAGCFSASRDVGIIANYLGERANSDSHAPMARRAGLSSRNTQRVALVGILPGTAPRS